MGFGDSGGAWIHLEGHDFGVGNSPWRANMSIHIRLANLTINVLARTIVDSKDEGWPHISLVSITFVLV